VGQKGQQVLHAGLTIGGGVNIMVKAVMLSIYTGVANRVVQDEHVLKGSGTQGRRGGCCLVAYKKRQRRCKQGIRCCINMSRRQALSAHCAQAFMHTADSLPPVLDP
jgi:hypothetical protein